VTAIMMGTTSVAEVYRIIKQWHFEDGLNHNAFEELTFSDATKIRLDPTDFNVKLKIQSTTNAYTDDANVWFRTWTTNPKALRKLLMIEIFPEVQPDDAEIYLRINNGTNDYYWKTSTSAWTIATASTHWNTEAEINAHITTFPILPGRTFAITVNLRSLDSRHEVTPLVREIRVLMEVHIDFIEDIVLRSLMPMVTSGITALANYAAIPAVNVALPATGITSINFSQYRKNTPYNITAIAAVYDIVNDPELLTNLYSSYNPTTQVITLSSQIPNGGRPFILMRYVPEVAYITHQDWLEVNKLPVILIQRVEVPVATNNTLASREFIVDKSTGNGVVIEKPWRANLDFRLHVLTSSLVDEMRLMSKVLEFFERYQFIRSVGIDEYYRLYLSREFRDMSNPDRSDQRAFWTKLTIYDVRMPFVSRDAKAVTRLVVNISEPLITTEDPAVGGSEAKTSVHSDGSPVKYTVTVEIE